MKRGYRHINFSLTVRLCGSLACLLLLFIALAIRPTISAQSSLDSVPAINCTVTVTNESELESATGWTMSAGTTVCLADGTYTDVELQIGGTGTAGSPITVAAENPGQVTIEGTSQVRMGGEYIVVQGLIFTNGNSDGSDLFQTRGTGSAPCHYCRMTEIAVIDWDQGVTNSSKWFNIYGTHNRVDHGWFTGKTTLGALMIVDRGESDSEPDYAQFDHNYFGNRPPRDGKEYPDPSDNEMEIIRIGDSATHTIDSFSRIEYNYVENAQGEAEVFSIKAGHNTVSHNTIRNSYGSITSRHGSSTTISNNFIFGDGYPFSGGIRLVDDGHIVTNNYIADCTYANTTHHGGIVMLGADGNDTNGYQQFENVMIAHNTVVGCVNSLNIDGGNKSRNPESVTLVNNIIADAVGAVLVQSADGMPINSTIDGNYFYGESYSDSTLADVPGITFVDPMLVMDTDGVYRPAAGSPAIDGGVSSFATSANFPSVDDDMDGQARDGSPDAGADEVSADTVTNRPLTSNDVGPGYMNGVVLPTTTPVPTSDAPDATSEPATATPDTPAATATPSIPDPSATETPTTTDPDPTTLTTGADAIGAGDTVQLWFFSPNDVGNVALYYTINDGDEIEPGEQGSSNGRLNWDVAGLVDGDVIEYWFTYDENDAEVSTTPATYTLTGGTAPLAVGLESAVTVPSWPLLLLIVGVTAMGSIAMMYGSRMAIHCFGEK